MYPQVWIDLFLLFLAHISEFARGEYLPDSVASAQANPLGDGAVLTLSFGKLLLGAERLVALQGIQKLVGGRGKSWVEGEKFGEKNRQQHVDFET